MKRQVEVTATIQIEADSKNGLRTAMKAIRLRGCFPMACFGPGYSWKPKTWSVSDVSLKSKNK